MKKTLKIVTLAVCALLLVAIGVAGTIAYFTWTGTVENTFTVGKVTATLDEAKVDEYGVKDGDKRVSEGNTFNVIPGHTYTKDPVITIGANSEDAWVFVKVDNEIAALETTTAAKTIDGQLKANGWTAYTVAGVYYKSYTKSAADTKLATFTTFTVATTVENGAEGGKITVSAYAIQKDGIATVADAYAKLFPAT